MASTSLDDKPSSSDDQIIDTFAFQGLLRDHQYDTLQAMLDINSYLRQSLVDLQNATQFIANGDLDSLAMQGMWLQVRSNAIGVRMVSLLAKRMWEYANLCDGAEEVEITKQEALMRIRTFVVPSMVCGLCEAAEWFNRYFETDLFWAGDARGKSEVEESEGAGLEGDTGRI